MEFRFEEKGFWVDPSLSEEQREEVTKGMRRVLEGAKQNFVGEKRREWLKASLKLSTQRDGKSWKQTSRPYTPPRMKPAFGFR